MAENKTNIGLRFFKGAYGKGDKRNLPSATGAIIFNEDEQIIYVNGKPYGGACNVTFADNVLTITYADGTTPVTLDFSDTASAKATMSVFEQLENIIGENFTKGGKELNYTNTNYLSKETTLVNADKALDAAIKAVDERIDAMDVASNTVDGTNVHVTYKQEDGIVTVERVTEDYATLTETEYVKQVGQEGQEGYVGGVNPALVVKKGDEDKLLKASNVATIAKYTDDKVKQLEDKVNSQVDDLDVDGYVQGEYPVTGNITIAGIKEENGKISRDTTKDVTINVNHAYSKEDTNLTYLATAETVRGAIDSLDKTSTEVTRAEGQTSGNISFKYSETDGIVTIDNLKEEYATISKTDGAANATDSKFVVKEGDEDKLVKASDVQDVATFAEHRIDEKIAKLDVEAQTIVAYADEDKKQLQFTTSVSETDGKIAKGETVENLYFASAVTDQNRLVTEAEISDMLGALVYRGTVATKAELYGKTDVKNGDVYVASTDFDYTEGEKTVTIEAGDMFIYTKGTEEDATGKWQIVSGENQVTNENKTITAGAATTTKIATVDGTDITVGVNVTAGIATIATVADDVVTIKAGVKQGENTGTLAQGEGDDIVLAKVAHTGKAVDVSIADTDNVITATTVEGALAEIAKEIDAMDANFTGDNAAKDNKGNVTVSLTETDGKVDTLSVAATYATISSSKDGESDTTLTGTNGTGLLIGTDVATIATFTNTRIAEEVAKLDATVMTEAAPAEGAKQTNTVRVQVDEVDGKLTSVAATVLGAVVVAKESEDDEEGSTLKATNSNGAVLGSDVEAFKKYIDAQAAKSTTKVTNYTVENGNVTTTVNDDAIVIDETTGTDGSTSYNVRLVWSEWNTTTNA